MTLDSELLKKEKEKDRVEVKSLCHNRKKKREITTKTKQKGEA